MKPGACVAGLFIERHRVRLATAVYTGDAADGPAGIEPVLNPTGRKEFGYQGEYATDGTTFLTAIGRHLAKLTGGIDGLGIASYGPFDNLKRDEKLGIEGYGRIAATPRADSPFCGLDLPAIFKAAFEATEVAAPPMAVHTDASAGALGEAVFRKLHGDDVVVYLMLTEGIGGGYVTGRSIGSGALHPEMGLIEVTSALDDPLLRGRSPYRHERTLGKLAGTAAMLDRARACGLDGRELKQILRATDRGLWPVWSRYVAQLCLTCTVMLAPKVIVLGGPLAQGHRALHMVRQEFESLWRDRSSGPIPVYDALDKGSYISAPSEGRLGPELVGALHLAARAEQPRPTIGGNVVRFRSRTTP